MEIKNWSKYQLDIFEDVRSGTGHTIVDALAGSAKTTSLIESLNHIPPGLKWLLVAFNKRIAEELKFRAAPGGEISTIHSLGLKSLGSTLKQISVDNDKVPNILKKLFKDSDQKDLRYELRTAVSLCKGYLAHTALEIDEVLDKHDIDFAGLEREDFINHVINIMDICKSQMKIVDFDDMVYLPNVIKCKVPKFDRVLIDEAQDLTKAQLNLVLQTVQGPPKTKKGKSEGRITVFLDKNQAIYGWSGADIKAVENMIETLNAKSLPLSISYRCPIAVIKEAQKIVPTIEAAPNAKQGKVAYITTEEMKQHAKPGCFIISRVNAPLIGLAMHFIKNGIPANIQGRDIGQNLLTLVKSSKAKTLDKFLDYVHKWKAKEIARLVKYERDTTQVSDKAECLLALSENVNSIAELKSNIEKLFADTEDSKKIILSSIHKVKGGERDIVYVLWSTLRYSNQEEHNLRYVAITRSKNELYFVKNIINE